MPTRTKLQILIKASIFSGPKPRAAPHLLFTPGYDRTIHLTFQIPSFFFFTSLHYVTPVYGMPLFSFSLPVISSSFCTFTPVYASRVERQRERDVGKKLSLKLINKTCRYIAIFLPLVFGLLRHEKSPLSHLYI